MTPTRELQEQISTINLEQSGEVRQRTSRRSGSTKNTKSAKEKFITLMSPWTRSIFPFAHNGADVEGEHDTCHPFFICFGVTLVGSTCPHGNSRLVLIVPCWHAKLSSLLRFADDDVVVGIVKTCIEGFSLHFVEDNLHPDLRH